MHKRRSRTYLPGLEAIERRLMPTVYLQSGFIKIIGNNLISDNVFVQQSGSSYVVNENGRTTTFPVSSVTGGGLYFYGYGGHDRFETTTNLNVVADGGRGNDTLSGGGGRDRLIGGYGSDTLAGRLAADELYGGGYNNPIDDGIN